MAARPISGGAPAVVPALDVGGTHVTAALVELPSGRLHAGRSHRRQLRSDASAEELLTTIVACAAAVEPGDGAHWGVAIPGPFDYAGGIGRFQGVGKFEALYGVDVGRALRDGLGRACAEVAFLNDADAFLLGEWVAGAAAGHRRAAGITLGTGVGSAFLADGAIVDAGPDVPPEGRVDLLTIAGHPLEDTISRRALLARYADLSGRPLEPGWDVLHIAERARRGDVAGRRTIDDALTALGVVLAPWLTRFHASVLVVGGAITGSWDLIAPPLRAGLDSDDAPPRIDLVTATHPAEANLIGAAHHARSAAGPRRNL